MPEVSLTVFIIAAAAALLVGFDVVDYTVALNGSS